MRTIPPITKNLLIINIICFLAAVVFEGRGISLNEIFGLHYFQATDFRIYQVLTYMFMHGGLTHLFFNMFALWMFGGVVEQTFGRNRFLAYYIICGFGAALCQEVSQAGLVYSIVSGQGGTLQEMLHLSSFDRQFLNEFTTVGASGSIYGILLAFGMSYPEQRMFVFPLPVPIKAKWFVVGYAAIELFLAMSQRGDGVAHVAHLGGMLFGFILIKIWKKRSPAFNGWDGYEIREKKKSASILGRIRKWMHLDRGNGDEDLEEGRYNKSYKQQQDWDYNAQKRKEEEEIDKILDKIRRSGYGSLTDEEKKKLFDKGK